MEGFKDTEEIQQVLIELNKSGSGLLNLFKSVRNKLTSFIKGEERKEPQDYGDTLVFNHKNELLLLRRNASDTEFQSGKWCLPGGKIEAGETPIQGAQRELVEETAIDAGGKLQDVESRLLGNGSTIYYHKLDYDKDQLIGLDNDEHYSYEWVDLTDLDNYDCLLDLKEYLKETLLPKIDLPEPIKVEANTLFKSLFIESMLEKSNSNLNFEWRDRKTKTGKIFKQRFRVNHNKEQIEHQPVELPNDLKEKLFTAHLYDGNYYTKQGEKIELTSAQKHTALKMYDSKYNASNIEAELFGTGDQEKDDFKKLIPVIEKKNSIFNDVHESRTKEKIERYLQVRQTPEYAQEYFEQLTRVRSLFSEDIDPTIITNIRGREVETSLSDLISQMQSYDDVKYVMLPITSISVKNLDDYTSEDFADPTYYNDIYEEVNNRLKSQVDELQKAMESIQLGFDAGIVSDDLYIKYLQKYNNFMKGQTKAKISTSEEGDDEDDESEDDGETQQQSDETQYNDGEEQQNEGANEGADDDKSTTGHTNDELLEFAKTASLKDLQQVIAVHGDEMLRKVAHEEIARREQEEHVQPENDGEGEDGEQTDSDFNDPNKIKQFIKEKEENGDGASDNPFIKEMADEINDYANSEEHKEVEASIKNLEFTDDNVAPKKDKKKPKNKNKAKA